MLGGSTHSSTSSVATGNVSKARKIGHGGIRQQIRRMSLQSCQVDCVSFTKRLLAFEQNSQGLMAQVKHRLAPTKSLSLGALTDVRRVAGAAE